VPVRVGVPGLLAVVQQGAVVLLGWERGDPARPYCVPSWELGATVALVQLNSSLVLLGGDVNHVDPLVTKKDLKALYNAISTAAVLAGDGGATLKAAIITALNVAGWSGALGDGQLGSNVVAAKR
jgi:hypothetical protein